ncbi:MAG: HDOD domain-containing protein [Candidatus Synoicihabitans palmerolidicus]|nr:HDOD domain-containing protein [Candidatus Synoicihabitans palmerolidicus]
MPELVKIIRALSKDEGAVSISELAEMINQDSTVLMRVISAANTFGYNPTNIEINTVAEAIHTIGFNRVRMLSMSLMLLDHAGRSNSPTEQRQMASVSLCSGIVAQITAEHAGVLNPEHSFVCASLRNFGRLLLGTFMNSEFREAMIAADAGEGDDAYKRLFGLTPFELGYELLKSANLPASILNAIRQNEPAAGQNVSWSDKAMHKLATFSLELSKVALDGEINDHPFVRAQTRLVKKAGKEFPFLLERAPNLLSEAEQRLSILASSTGNVAFGRVSREHHRHRSRRTPIDGKPVAIDTAHPPSYLPASEAMTPPGIHSPASGASDAGQLGPPSEKTVPVPPRTPHVEFPSVEAQTPIVHHEDYLAAPAKPASRSAAQSRTHSAMDTAIKNSPNATVSPTLSLSPSTPFGRRFNLRMRSSAAWTPPARPSASYSVKVPSAIVSVNALFSHGATETPSSFAMIV